ncbi:hypothetical protein [Nocardioides panacisoli]|uniref:DUF4333 domain-containing protein n=1 Tax=Nocardioides panacisoli TaxID=627624 RepID=A0ABP7INF3_9ACTN
MSYPPPPPPPQPNQPGQQPPYQQPQQPYQQPYQQQYGAQQPYQYGGPQPPYQPPPPAKKGGSGCLVAVVVVVVVMLLVCGVGGFFIWRAAKDVTDTIKNTVPGLGGAECPSEGDVSDKIGSDVSLDLSGNVVVAAGCYYSGDKVQITLAKGAGVIADDEIKSVREEAANNGVEAQSIDVGDGGVVYATPTVVDAITKSDGALFEVEVDAQGSTDLSGKADAGVDILKAFIDAQ